MLPSVRPAPAKFPAVRLLTAIAAGRRPARRGLRRRRRRGRQSAGQWRRGRRAVRRGSRARPLARALGLPAGEGPQPRADLVEADGAVNIGPGHVGVHARARTAWPSGCSTTGAASSTARSAVYLARTPNGRARGPFPAPADPLVVEPPFRSRGAAEPGGDIAAIYDARVKLPSPGRWYVLAVTNADGRAVRRAVPDPGERAREHPRRGGARAAGEDRHAGLGRRRHRVDRHPRAAERHARAELRRGGRQEAGGAAVRHAAAVPDARVRARWWTSPSSCGAATATGWPSSTRRSTTTTWWRRACGRRCRPSACAPSRGCSRSTAKGKVAARLEGSFGTEAFEEAVKAALPASR